MLLNQSADSLQPKTFYVKECAQASVCLLVCVCIFFFFISLSAQNRTVRCLGADLKKVRTIRYGFDSKCKQCEVYVRSQRLNFLFTKGSFNMTP